MYEKRMYTTAVCTTCNSLFFFVPSCSFFLLLVFKFHASFGLFFTFFSVKLVDYMHKVHLQGGMTYRVITLLGAVLYAAVPPFI